MQFTPAAPKFNSATEARTEFLCGRLPWSRDDTAAMLTIRKDHEGKEVIHGHRLVRVVDVVAISPSKDPVYQCLTEWGQLVQAEQRILMDPQALLFNPDGHPSAYAQWMRAKDDARRLKELRGHRTKVVAVSNFASN